MSDRLALLRGILANPDDDLRRLVYADWLDDHGTTDADKARAEFIRLGCKMKAKAATTLRETKCLEANWMRLLPVTVAIHSDSELVYTPSKGKQLALRLISMDMANYPETGWIEVDFVRGFLEHARFADRLVYDRTWRAVATDEPLARFIPPLLSQRSHFAHPSFAAVRPSDWGNAVWIRTRGFAKESSREKIFAEMSSHLAPDHCRLAISDAMTAIAREYTGLTPAPEA